MLTYYQPFILPFLHPKRYVLPHGIFQKHFLSFEDALWTILAAKNIPSGSVILLPDFYCMDVVENIRRHGYTPVFYPLDDNFQISNTTFVTLIRRNRPQVIILFHACGITNKVAKDIRYMRSLCEKALVIEDCVHRLINPSTMQLVHTNHIAIDSIRKVSPLYGSFMYSKFALDETQMTNKQREYSYILFTHLLYTLFRMAFVLGVMFRSYRLVSYAHTRLLRFHDDLVGDSTYGYKGKRRYKFLHRFINFSYIEKLKEKQIALYASLLSSLYKKGSPWYEVGMPQSDKKYLHVYPLGFNPRSRFGTKEVETLLQNNRIPVWFKFLDCPWSQMRSVMFLPLGFHVTNNDIKRVCSLLTQSHHSLTLNS